MPDTPLKPTEFDTYRTDVATAAEARDTDSPTPGQDARPWMGFGLVLAMIFGLALVLALLAVLR